MSLAKFIPLFTCKDCFVVEPLVSNIVLLEEGVDVCHVYYDTLALFHSDILALYINFQCTLSSRDAI